MKHKKAGMVDKIGIGSMEFERRSDRGKEMKEIREAKKGNWCCGCEKKGDIEGLKERVEPQRKPVERQRSNLYTGIKLTLPEYKLISKASYTFERVHTHICKLCKSQKHHSFSIPIICF